MRLGAETKKQRKSAIEKGKADGKQCSGLPMMRRRNKCEGHSLKKTRRIETLWKIKRKKHQS
ncbi:hypothetical protein D3Z62_07215 [Lachnospiraceae bacterium]|nr:hypothetical protein [Lachnospiraceae bacterium]